MNSYVELQPSPADLVAAAYALQAEADELKAKLIAAMSAIAEAESDPEVFTGDDFAGPFEAKYKEVQDGTPTNLVLRRNVRQIGQATSELGDDVVTAMSHYVAMDEGNAGEIVDA